MPGIDERRISQLERDVVTLQRQIERDAVRFRGAEQLQSFELTKATLDPDDRLLIENSANGYRKAVIRASALSGASGATVSGCDVKMFPSDGSYHETLVDLLDIANVGESANIWVTVTWRQPFPTWRQCVASRYSFMRTAGGVYWDTDGLINQYDTPVGGAIGSVAFISAGVPCTIVARTPTCLSGGTPYMQTVSWIGARGAA